MRRRRTLVALVALGLAAGCSGGDGDRIGTEEEFCDDALVVVESLETLGAEVDVAPNDLARVRDDLRSIRAPEDLRTDLDLLADLMDEVLVGLDGADLSDEEVLADFQDRLSALEARATELQDAGDRIFLALQSCRDDG